MNHKNRLQKLDFSGIEDEEQEDPFHQNSRSHNHKIKLQKVKINNQSTLKTRNVSRN